jgi:nucleoside-diphosphate kinase
MNAKQPNDVTIDVTLKGDQVEVATHGLKKDSAITCAPARTVEHHDATALIPSTIQKTFAMIKPDAVQTLQSGRIITMIELNKFSIINMRKIQLTKKQAEGFYAEHKNKSFFKDLIDYMTSGPVIMMVLEKNNAIEDWRTLIGSTNPAQARPGTLRAMFGTDKAHNAVHGSDSQTSAEQEIEFFLNLK